MPTSLHWRAVGRCSTDVMSEVIERGALVEAQKPADNRGEAPGIRANSANLHAAGRPGYQGEKSLATAQVKQIWGTRIVRVD